MDILSCIDNVDYFSGVSRKSKEMLAAICIPKQCAKKTTVFTEGEKGFAFYLLASGSVGLYKGMECGRDIMIKMVHPGEPFAEVILFEQHTFPVTAIALKASLLYSIPKAQFICLLTDEQFRNDFIGMLMRKQRYLAERIRYLTMNDVEERFIIFLREKQHSYCNRIGSYSKKDIASAIGTTPETYSRLLARLVKEKRIFITGKLIKLNGK